MTIIKTGMSLLWAFTSLALPSTAHAHPDFDPQAEVKSIVDAYLMPAAKEAQDAINLAATDPQKACDLAKHAALSMTAADQKLAVLHDKLVQNDYDPSALLPVQDKVKAGVQQMAALPQTICSGEFAKVQTDPNTQAMMQKIGGYMNAYTNDLSVISKAQQANDMPTFCAHAQDGDKQLRDLSAYLVDLRKTTHFSQTELTALDGLNTKITDFKTANDARLMKCTTSP